MEGGVSAESIQLVHRPPFGLIIRIAKPKSPHHQRANRADDNQRADASGLELLAGHETSFAAGRSARNCRELKSRGLPGETGRILC
jgi:hypothetical protein